MIVSLIGFRGAGKSTVGRRLSEVLGAGFEDSDRVIVTRAGKSIAEIFEASGEAAFRDLEEQCIAEILEGWRERLVARNTGVASSLVLAAGGGAVLREATCARLRAAGPVVWLEAGEATVRARLARDPATAASRPALRGGADPLDEIAALLAERRPIYELVADHRVVVDGSTVDEVVAAIQQAVSEP